MPRITQETEAPKPAEPKTTAPSIHPFRRRQQYEKTCNSSAPLRLEARAADD
jgi:hypothetical protein